MDQQERYDNLKLGERGAIVSIVAYIVLSAFKLIVGYIAGSEALRADGMNNATDIVASVAVLVGLRLAQKPADRNHRYGHWKSETIASLISSFIMAAVGLQVLFAAVSSVFGGSEKAPDPISVWAGLFSAAAMYFVYRYNRRLAVRINSQAVMAAAKDNVSDALVSVGAVIGIVGSQFGLPWLDPVAAVAVGLLICKTAWDIFRDASHHLSDGFDESTIESFKEAILEVEGVEAVKDIKARNYGSSAVVDVVVLVNMELDFAEAHEIATSVENKLKKTSEVYEVHVHYEPVDVSEMLS
ncbi:cation diffusion facilitator family transporter [Cohnella ginsengisoli]|uniref:Cation diffusion facilitator family transporter n=1 Tax=Cohnella ginsengisoli TaxID=425004 RepID=A0A9X4QMX4_9BACL|nr:cation diffusion facilitator family transporter [Cohnella ginsengisoli]MDG0792198.1 cation diffusion facilitator family transporter [Cohnella ginsengisoli]